MRYSFIIPYYKRSRELWFTLLSFRHWYGKRNDVEYLIVEDGANFDDDTAHQELIDTLYAFGDLNWTHLISDAKKQYNPVIHRNLAASVAKGLILVNTNPECWHRSDILSAVDKLVTSSVSRLRNLPENFGPGHPQWKVPSFQQKYYMSVAEGSLTKYIVCACENAKVNVDRPRDFDTLSKNTEHKQWYQHSQHNNRRLHWCSFISKHNYNKIEGFDEAYANYCGYDDDDFREKVLAANIPLEEHDELVVVHTAHDCSHQDNTMPMSEAGLAYFKQKWPKVYAVIFK